MTLLLEKMPKSAARKLAYLQNQAWLPPALLLLALSSAFLFGGDRNYYYQEDEHKKLAIAENLSIDRHFLLFVEQDSDADGKPAFEQSYDQFPIGGYALYGRFPIGGYALIRLAILPFGDNLSAKIYAARMLMLLCFAAAAALAYLALRRITSNRWIALTAVLLAFSSPHLLYNSDVINTEVTIDLFAVMLVFHGMALFEQERRFRQLMLKTGAALLLGWHVYALLLPFIAFGLMREIIKARSDASPTLSRLRHTARALIRSRYLTLGVAALLFGASALTFNFANEYFALNREIPPTELPSFQSMTIRTGAVSFFEESRDDYLSLFPLLERQFYRVGMMALPYALSPSFVEDREDVPRLFVILGIAAFVASLIGLPFIRRNKILLASLTLSGFCWALPMRNITAFPWHHFEAIFYVGVTLTLFSLVLLYLRRTSGEPLIVALSVAALLVFVVSALRMSQLNNTYQMAELRNATIADFESIRSMTNDGDLIETNTIPKLYRWITIFAYYLSGRIGISANEAVPPARQPDFVITSVRLNSLASLTPQNQMIFLYEWDAYRMRITEIIETGEPIIRSGFDVHLIGNGLMYVKDDCRLDDISDGFFLALFPVDETDLPANRRQHGFANLDFRFEEQAIRHGERCIAIIPFPKYDIARIQTGQLIQRADGSYEHLWEGEIHLTEMAH